MSAADQRARGSFTTRRPVAISMVFLAALVFGIFSLRLLPVTLMPELSYPTLTVRTEYPGAAPEEVENDVSRPVEEALGVVSGLRRISSVSRAGVSDVILEFTWDTEMTDAVQDSLEKLDLILLPNEAERPLILRFDPSLDPVMELSLSGSGDRYAGEQGLRRVRRLADLQVKRDLEKIPGVAAARVRGGLEEEIHVLIDEQRLQRTGISIQEVIDRLRQENINLAGGTITEGRTEYMVRTLNEYQDLGQIEDTVVARYDDRGVRVRDLGSVERGHKERQIITRTDESESVQIDIFKEADANIVALAGRVKAALGDFDIAAAKKREAEAEKRAEVEEDEAEGEQHAAGGRGGRGGRGGMRMAGGGLVQQLYEQEGLEIGLVADRSVFIQNSIAEVRNTAILGGFLAVLVLLFFLKDLRTTAIIALAIPISLIVTFAPLNLFGVSLNIMSLGGLALGVGMLVDSSIVVLESIFRCREEGDDVESSAIRGTGEVRGAVIASTLTTIAVFFPMVFVEGVAGQAFGDLGMAVVVSLLAALVVALTLIPMLASRQGVKWSKPTEGYRWLHFASWRVFMDDLSAYFARKRGSVFGTALKWLGAAFVVIYSVVRFVVAFLLEVMAKLLMGVTFGLSLVARLVSSGVGRLGGGLRGNVGNWIDDALDATRDFYRNQLTNALGSSGRVLSVAVLALLLTGLLATRLDTELLPEVRQGEFTVEVTLPVGTPLEETEASVAPVERAILAEKEHVESLLLTVGYDATNSNRSDEGEHTARFKVLLDAEAHDDPTIEDQVLARMRQRFARIPDLEARVVRPVLFSFKAPIEVEVHGDDLVALRRQSEAVRRQMQELPQLTDVEVSQRRGAPEVQVVYDRALLARYELNPEQVARLVRDQVQGFEATRFNLKDRRIPIIVRLALRDRETVEDVETLIVNPGGERPIPLAAVADVSLAEGPSEVRRIDGRRVALVTANITPGSSMGSAVEAIRGRLNDIDWEAGSTFLIAGQNEEWERSRASLFLALALSIFLVYVIMAGQFESLLHPLVILFSIPFAFFGTVVALKLLGISLSIVVFLGMIMLAGIVVNNAIVLVDYINQLRDRGLAVEEAILEAGTVRLRPILMTTATTCLGLLPMALGAGDGAELRTPMAIAVISGLLVSTVLTLIIIPVVYLTVDRLRLAVAGRRTARERADDAGKSDEIDEAMAEPV